MAAAETFEAIATYTASGSQNTITFSSIPQTYTDLFIAMFSGNTSGSYYWTYIQVGNGSVDTGTNYYATLNSANNSLYRSDRYTSSTEFKAAGNDPNQKATNYAFIQGYSRTDIWKPCLTTMGFAATGSNVGWTGYISSVWKSTSAINTIKITLEGGQNFSGDSMYTLYGIKAA